ncbi:hypothetical protein ANAEL_02371 [Anaerolineales bacterium]|nr:hypothetical protein ANAEL_02371 [Anaerolineales bacterium]
MRKSTLFISVVLTTFMLAVLYGVVSVYQSIVGSTEMAAQPQTTEMTINQPVVVPPTQAIPPVVVNLTPEAAAALAGKVLGRTDLYSVEVTQFEGADVYLVTFSSGDLVYVSLDGQVLSISKLPVTTIVQSTGGGGGGGGNGSNNNSGGEHEDHDDHEEHEGDDD